MITLTVDNSYSRIEGLKSDQFNKLRKLLSYSIDAKAAYFSGRYGPRLKYMIDLKGNFPTGLIHRVVDFLFDQKISFSSKTKISIPKTGPSYCLQDVEPYPAQLEAVKAAETCRRGIISMPTGTGKSLVIALILARLNVNTLIVVPSLEIKKQLTDSLERVIGSLDKITVENIDSPTLKKSTKYDCLIIDECHHVAAKTYQKLNKTAWNGIYYRFFLTATPFRNQTEETLLFEGIAGQVIYKLSYKDAIKNGYIVPVEAYYIDLPKQKTEAFTWAEVYSELIVRNDVRNQIITDMAVKLDAMGLSTLVLVKEVAHGTAIAGKNSSLPFVNGQDDESRRLIQDFNSGKIKVLIGTEGILGEGVDTKPCEYVIIAGLGKAKSAFMQKVGRSVRKYPGKESAKVIIFRDAAHKFLLRHYREQCVILRDEYGVVPEKLEIGE